MDELLDAVDRRTACICYFGGDPTPQMVHSLRVARAARKRRGNGILRICWETNGAMPAAAARAMAEMALESGGVIKIDLKARDRALHRALCGTDNRQTWRNVRMLAGMASRRPEIPLLVVSTLLVPGYVDAEEVGAIASAVAAQDPLTPYALLAFHPCFMMNDLPTTSRPEAERALAAARAAGLSRVRLGNEHLLRG
jgi:pyruvate formate lyase activating enzyme